MKDRNDDNAAGDNAIVRSVGESLGNSAVNVAMDDGVSVGKQVNALQKRIDAIKEFITEVGLLPFVPSICPLEIFIEPPGEKRARISSALSNRGPDFVPSQDVIWILLAGFHAAI